jgi:hypothetical protein
MTDLNDRHEAITPKRVRHRLSIVIDALGTELTLDRTIYPDKLLTNIRQDLIEIRAACDYLEQNATKGKNDEASRDSHGD